MSELSEQIKEIIENEPVSVFMKGTPQLVMCGNSDRALRALRAAGAPVTAVDVLPDPQIRQELSALSGWPTIPQVFIKGELIGGADIVEELYASGELQAQARRGARNRARAVREDARRRSHERRAAGADAAARAADPSDPLPDPLPPRPAGPDSARRKNRRNAGLTRFTPR